MTATYVAFPSWQLQHDRTRYVPSWMMRTRTVGIDWRWGSNILGAEAKSGAINQNPSRRAFGLVDKYRTIEPGTRSEMT